MSLARKFQGELEQVLDAYRDKGLTRAEAIGTLVIVLLMFWLTSGEGE